jgi:hypothetical protein
MDEVKPLIRVYNIRPMTIVICLPIQKVFRINLYPKRAAINYL